MNKKVFLMLPAMMILFSGCALFNASRFNTIDNRPALIDTDLPASQNGHVDRGLRLPLSSRSAVNIDVECILDYVQGGSAFDIEIDANDWLIPWIRFDISY